MISHVLPSVLIARRGSISTERALKQIRELLIDVESTSASHFDRLTASIDDCETLLAAINRDET